MERPKAIHGEVRGRRAIEGKPADGPVTEPGPSLETALPEPVRVDR